MKTAPFTVTALAAFLAAASLGSASGDTPKSRAGAIAAVNGGAPAGHSAPSAGRSGGNIARGGRDGMHNGGGFHDGTNYRGGDWRNHRHGGFGYDNTIVLGGFGYPNYGYGYGYGGYPYGGFAYNEYAYPGYGGYYSEGNQSVYEGSVAERRGNNSLVAQLQRRLARGGYYHGSIDGIAGSGTRRAIRRFERDHGLPVDGEIDERLLSKIGLV